MVLVSCSYEKHTLPDLSLQGVERQSLERPKFSTTRELQRGESADQGDANTTDPPNHNLPEEDCYGYPNFTLFAFGPR